MAKKKKSKYLDIWQFKDDNYPFQIFLGGRGVGKTYSWLHGAVNGAIPEGKQFIHMRRTTDAWELQLDSKSGGEGANPFKIINTNEGCNYGFCKIVKKLAGIYHRESEDGKLQHVGNPIGLALSLKACASVRGLDFSSCTDWLYDEFVKEKHEPAFPGEGEFDALMNAYETFNRNRELEGQPPLRLWLVSNASDIYNPIFIGLNIVSVCEQMIRAGKKDKYIRERGLAIHLLEPTDEFKEVKAQTALYRLTEGTRFYDMALNNEFAYNDFSLIGARSIKGYMPICSVNDYAFIYRKKGESDLYITYTRAKCPNFDCNTKQGQMAFMKKIGMRIIGLFSESKIVFESYELKAIVTDYVF